MSEVHVFPRASHIDLIRTRRVCSFEAFYCEDSKLQTVRVSPLRRVTGREAAGIFHENHPDANLIQLRP
jgi:hypothetical protein